MEVLSNNENLTRYYETVRILFTRATRTLRVCAASLAPANLSCALETAQTRPATVT